MIFLLAIFALSLLLGGANSALAGADRLYLDYELGNFYTTTNDSLASLYTMRLGTLDIFPMKLFLALRHCTLDEWTSRSKTSTDANPESGYTRTATLGYISSVQYEGTVPLYLDQSVGGIPQYVTSTETELQPGYARQGTLGYIWPDLEACEVILYQDTNYSGSSVSISQDVSTLIGDPYNFNDKNFISKGEWRRQG